MSKSNGTGPADLTLATATAAKVKAIGNEARSAFVQRDEYISVLELAHVAGVPSMCLGKPGTGKSALCRWFGLGMGLPFFRRVLNPDIRREDLVGPIKPSSIAQDSWDRAWLGLATHPVVFLDEIGKASGQVQNMLLDAMEERLVESGNTTLAIPLHTLSSASNETLAEENPAVWDRFTLRAMVEYIDSSNDFVSFLTSRGRSATPRNISLDECANMRKACKQMAQAPSQAVLGIVVKMWSGIGTVTSDPISDRRWEATLVVAAAAALLDGRTEIGTNDLWVAKYILWSDYRKHKAIADFVDDTINQEAAEYRAAFDIFEELKEQLDQANRIEDRARVTHRSTRLSRDLAGKRGVTQEWDALLDSIDGLITQATEVI